MKTFSANLFPILYEWYKSKIFSAWPKNENAPVLIESSTEKLFNLSSDTNALVKKIVEKTLKGLSNLTLASK